MFIIYVYICEREKNCQKHASDFKSFDKFLKYTLTG